MGLIVLLPVVSLWVVFVGNWNDLDSHSSSYIYCNHSWTYSIKILFSYVSPIFVLFLIERSLVPTNCLFARLCVRMIKAAIPRYWETTSLEGEDKGLFLIQAIGKHHTTIVSISVWFEDTLLFYLYHAVLFGKSDRPVQVEPWFDVFVTVKSSIYVEKKDFCLDLHKVGYYNMRLRNGCHREITKELISVVFAQHVYLTSVHLKWIETLNKTWSTENSRK